MRENLTENLELRPLLVILGPTASGKTSLAVALACELTGEVISADSRQVYRGMDLGSGKDLAEYSYRPDPNGPSVDIPYHLINVAEAGEEYNIFRYQQAFDAAYADICRRGRVPVLCGGSGLYLSAALGRKRFVEVPENTELRATLQEKTDEELAHILASYGALHNHTDTETRERCLRAIEIAENQRLNPAEERIMPAPHIFGIHFEPEQLRRRIRQRLQERLQAGMVDEVKTLLAQGLKPGQLTYYGLEYKFLTLYVTGQIGYEQMTSELYFAICQFAKRQRTWFRKMEREGWNITWIEGSLSLSQKLDMIRRKIG